MTLRMTTFKITNQRVPIFLVVDARPPCNFGQDEGSRRQDRFVPLLLESSLRLLKPRHTVERLVKMFENMSSDILG